MLFREALPETTDIHFRPILIPPSRNQGEAGTGIFYSTSKSAILKSRTRVDILRSFRNMPITSFFGSLFDMKAVILAAGKGTRMKHLTEDRPKPMVEIGKDFILQRVLEAIRDAGIKDFVVVTGYFANLIEEHFGDGNSFGMNVQYVKQEVQDGTGSAVHLTRDAVGDEPFYMSFGDIIVSTQNYANLVQFYRDDPCDILLTVNHVEDPYRGAAVYVDDDWNVTKIIEKPPQGTSETNWNNAGIFIFSAKIYEYTANLTKSQRGEYELTEAIYRMLDDGLRIKAFPIEGFWGDIGTPEDVQKMTGLLEKKDTL